MIHLFRTSSITSIAYKTPKRNEKTQEAMNRAMKKWNLQYEKLVEFKRKNGHCTVPSSYEQDKAFGARVYTQQRGHTNNTIRLKRKELLDKLGFAWEVESIAARASREDKKWHQQYEKLVEFKRKNGHCIVPFNYEQDKSLGKWVSMQRTNHTKKTIRLDRKELLDELGFAWKVDPIAARASGEDKKWHQQYEKLVEFKQINGHCIVPRSYEQDKAFGAWVSMQRRVHTNNTIRLERKELLDELGFVWRVAPITAHTSTMDDVRGLVIGSSQLMIIS